MSNETKFDFKFYHWEKTFKDKPFLRQPFGENWEEYTWGEVGQLARKLAKSDVLKIVSKFKKPPMGIRILFSILSFSFWSISAASAFILFLEN